MVIKSNRVCKKCVREHKDYLWKFGGEAYEIWMCPGVNSEHGLNREAIQKHKSALLKVGEEVPPYCLKKFEQAIDTGMTENNQES